jgi:hypothetical protein
MSYPQVKPERSGWRDSNLDTLHPNLGITSIQEEILSLDHRKWGFNSPATDLDFLLAEYNHGKVKAIVDYKLFGAPELSPWNKKALFDLAVNHNPPLPLFVTYYDKGLTSFEAHCLTGEYPNVQKFDRLGWVSFLMKVRAR